MDPKQDAEEERLDEFEERVDPPGRPVVIESRSQ